MTQEEMLAFVRHGGRLDDAERAYPDAQRPWIDLSTGINPVPWRAPSGLLISSAPLPALADLAALEAAAARHFGVAADRVAAVPGSEIALRLLPMLSLASPIVAVRPCYGTHLDVADVSVAAAALGEGHAGTLLIANPNNPDGHVTGTTALHRLADRQRGEGGWLVIDEAFADATPAASILPTWHDAMRVVVLRSFGKFFGLAGVRLGFVVAPATVIARVRRLLGDWPVGAQAIAWGRAAYADGEWIAATRASLAERAARLDALLARRALPATGGSPLFRLVRTADARSVFERLARAGILTRPFGYRANWLRFGLPPDEEAFARLDRALSDG